MGKSSWEPPRPGVSIAASAELDPLLVLSNQIQDPPSRQRPPVEDGEPQGCGPAQVASPRPSEALPPCVLTGSCLLEFRRGGSLLEPLAGLRKAYILDSIVHTGGWSGLRPPGGGSREAFCSWGLHRKEQSLLRPVCRGPALLRLEIWHACENLLHVNMAKHFIKMGGGSLSKASSSLLSPTSPLLLPSSPGQGGLKGVRLPSLLRELLDRPGGSSPRQT